MTRARRPYMALPAAASAMNDNPAANGAVRPETGLTQMGGCRRALQHPPLWFGGNSGLETLGGCVLQATHH